MKNFNKYSLLAVLAILAALSTSGVIISLAATTPSLGAATSYGVLAGTYTNTTAGTTINGDVGFTTGPAVAPAGVHTNYGSGAPYATAGIDQGNTLSALASQSCTFTFAPGAVNLSTDTTHGAAGVYAPGVYCSTGAMDVGGSLTLSGSGTYIFRPVGALTSTAGSVVTLAGASACNVFWTPSAATTLAANTTFAGTVIDDSAITVGANTTWTGRALAFGGTVTTDTDTITVPTCAIANDDIATTPDSPASGTINVVKTVINDNGGIKTVTDFPLFVDGDLVVSGATNTFPAPAAYTVTETVDSNYVQTFSGDCDVNGDINLTANDNMFCIVTNNDVAIPTSGVVATSNTSHMPPLIDVVKVPNPLALPNGAGAVTYTYTLRNIGMVPVTNVKMVGDTCSPIKLVSGDTNADTKLDVNETWVHTCTTTLSKTHTNTVAVTGWANGSSATDIASATVVVGSPAVPPLIHVTKVPSRLTLPARGGVIVYTEKITNPGTIALSDVQLTDDKCNPTKYISGDTNNDLKLDATESWTYTCRSNLKKTTTNTAIASGTANGIRVKDIALATVVVATVPKLRQAAEEVPEVIPKLPNTGFGPEENSAPWKIILIAGIFAASLLLRNRIGAR